MVAIESFEATAIIRATSTDRLTIVPLSVWHHYRTLFFDNYEILFCNQTHVWKRGLGLISLEVSCYSFFFLFFFGSSSIGEHYAILQSPLFYSDFRFHLCRLGPKPFMVTKKGSYHLTKSSKPSKGIVSIMLSDAENNNLGPSVAKVRTFSGCQSCPKGFFSAFAALSLLRKAVSRQSLKQDTAITCFRMWEHIRTMPNWKCYI